MYYLTFWCPMNVEILSEARTSLRKLNAWCDSFCKYIIQSTYVLMFIVKYWISLWLHACDCWRQEWNWHANVARWCFEVFMSYLHLCYKDCIYCYLPVLNRYTKLLPKTSNNAPLPRRTLLQGKLTSLNIESSFTEEKCHLHCMPPAGV